MTVLIDLAFFFTGAAVLVLFVRWWQRDLPLRAALGYVALTMLFWSPGLLCGRHQVATDIAYWTLPFRAEVGPRFLPANALLTDPTVLMLPFRHLARQRLLALEAPLWAHELGTGQPLLANGQSAPFAPLFLMVLPLPPLRALEVAVALQSLLGLLLAHALLRRLGASPAAAAFAAVAYAFSSFAVAWAFYPVSMTAMWLPGVVLGVVSLGQQRPRAFAGLVLCTVGMALSGHPETLAIGALAAAATSLVVLVSARAGMRLSLARSLVFAPLLAFALSAPALLPVLEVVPRSERAARLAENPQASHPPPFEPRFLALVLDPLHFGNPRDGTWKAPVNFNEQASLYAGASTLALALAGALVLRSRALGILAGGALALAAAMGISPWLDLVASLPLVGQAAWARLRLLFVLAVAVAGGLTLDQVGRRGPDRAGLRLAAGAALVAAAAGLILLDPTPESRRAWHLTQTWAGVWRLGTATGLLVLGLAHALPRRISSRRLPALALGVLAADLALLGVRYNPALPAKLSLGPPLPPALAFLIDEQALGGEPFRVTAEESGLSPNLAALFGLWDARVYDPARPSAPARAVAQRILGSYRPEQWLRLGAEDDDAEAHGSLAIRYRLTLDHRQLAPPWTLAFRGRGGSVWRNEAAAPLFHFSRSNAPSTASPSGGVGGRPRGRVAVAAVTGNGFALEIESPAGGFVASSVSWDPGWRLELDGEPKRVVAIENGAFLGFEVPPGQHRATLGYAPWSWRLGLDLAVLGLLAVTGSAIARRRAGRRPARARPRASPNRRAVLGPEAGTLE